MGIVDQFGHTTQTISSLERRAGARIAAYCRVLIGLAILDCILWVKLKRLNTSRKTVKAALP